MQPSDIVTGIERGESSAGEALYGLLSAGPRRCMLGRFGPLDNEDRLHNLYLAVAGAILEHRIEPEALYGFIWGTVRNLSHEAIRWNIRARNHSEPLSLLTRDTRPNAEAMLIAGELGTTLRRAMRALDPRGREAVRRFYLLEQSSAAMERAMGLSPNALRIVRSRAVSRLRVLANAQ